MASQLDKSLLLSVVVPVLNEEESVLEFIELVTAELSREKNLNLEFVFVDDGSVDRTLGVLLGAQHSDNRIKIIELSRNFGKEAALTAGLKHASGRIVVPIDVDLQDPPSLIPEMIKLWRQGYEVVEGRRVNRDSDSLAKRVGANIYYKFFNLFSDVKITPNVGDFRLMDRAVVSTILDLEESQRFNKGLFAWVGFRTCSIDYSRPLRASGKSKFSATGLLDLGIQGVTSFSPGLLRVWAVLGFFFAVVSIFFGLWIILQTTLFGVAAPGYASTIVTVTFLGGLQLFGLGVLGEYLGKTYLEAKRRPAFVVRSVYSSKTP
jgi:glycosyltransferase involved in cell wall biosynthesis